MKVLHIINNLGSGGAEKLIADTLPLMNKFINLEVELLILTSNNNVFEEKLLANNIKIHKLDVKNIYNPFNIFKIKSVIQELSLDLIHIHLFPVIYWATIANFLNFKTETPLVLTEHNTHNRRRNHKFFKFIDKFIYNQIDKIISISEDTQSNLKKWLDSDKDDFKFEIVNNGIDTEKFQNAKPYKKNELIKEYNTDNVLVTMVGRFSEQKDQKTLIKAINNLPYNFHLLLVGRGTLKSDFEKLVEDLDLNNRVHFLGFRKDIERILKTSDIIVLSSNWEGFGLAAVEGMAAKKPLIASDVSGLKEIVEDAGLLFEAGNESKLVNLIKKLSNDQEFYDEIAQKCFNRAKEYDLKKMVKKEVALYNKILFKS